MIMSRPVLLRMRNISHEVCRGNQNAFHLQQSFDENRAVYQIIWKNTVGSNKPQSTIKCGAEKMSDN